MKRHLTLLVVDDDAVDRMATRRALRGHEVIEAVTVIEAERVLTERPVDVVLLDYFIPPDTAPDALRRLRAIRPGVPALILSGQGSEDVVAEVLRAGADDYLPKAAVSEPRRLSMLVERTHAAAEMRQQHERAQVRLGLALEASGADIWSVDRERTQVTGGPRFFSLFDVADDRESLPWSMWTALFAPEDAARLQQGLAEGVIAFQAKLRSGRWVELRGKRDADGGAFGTVMDVSATREAEARTLAMKDRLMGIASHDLKNPLSAVRMGARLLSQSERLTDAERRVVDHVSTSAERMTRLISQLLDLTRVRLGGGLPLEPRNVDLKALLNSLIDEAALGTNRSFERELEPIEVHADPDRLGQVISNLLGNAVTHGAPNAPITVRSRVGDGLVRIEVENRGVPIPPEVLESLFEPFVQVRAATRDGLGLGLFISRELMRTHHGGLTVRSSPDGVICFVAELPLKQPAQKTDADQ